MNKPNDYPAYIMRQLHGDYTKPPRKSGWRYVTKGILGVVWAMLMLVVCLFTLPIHALYKLVVAVLFRRKLL